ncbi:hypothetical protein ACC716_37625, partial [Rhizobium johnstonii]|uniref:hypothetical protein n=1 Tax=Rhizobium johnstonii TaxID=3019933 RepID=UPI003F985960
LELQMPPEMKNIAVSGSMLFYCAYNSQKDKKFILSPDPEGRQLLTNQVKPGNYTVKLEWRAGNKNYYSEKNITIP